MQLQVEPRRRFKKSGRLWTPEEPRVECIGGVAGGSFAARGLAAGAGGHVQPSAISGMLLDLDPAALTPGTLSSWTDIFSGYIFDDQGVSTRRPTAEADNWFPGSGIQSVLFDGSNDMLVNETGFAEAFASGSDNTYTLASVVQYVSIPTGTHLYFACTNKTTIAQFVDFGKMTSAGDEDWRVGRDDDLGSSITITTPPVPTTSRHVFVVVFHGTTLDIYLDGVDILSQHGVSKGHNVGTVTLDRTCIGARFRGTSTIQAESNVRIGRIVAYDHDITAAEARGLGNHLRSKYRV